jgi:ATP-dependent Lon protease
VLVEGVKRAKIEEFFQADDYTEVKVSEFVLESGQDTEIKAMMRLALESFESYIKLNKKIPEEVLGILKEVSDVERFSDIIIANLSLKTAEKQELLGGINAQTRLDKILSVIQGEIDVLGTERKIQSRVRKQMRIIALISVS